MPTFEYQALNKSGKTVTAICEADNLKQARQQLRAQEFTVLNIKPVTADGVKRGKQTISLWKRLNTKKMSIADLCLFTRQLATLMGAGVSLEEALGSIAEQSEKPQVKSIVTGIRDKIMEGFGLASALSDYPRVFSELYCATVGAGEKTGRLETVLEKLADFTERRQQVRQQILQAAIYPSIIALASISIVGFLLAFVVPKMVGVFAQNGQVLPPMTQLLLTISAAVQAAGIYVAIGIIVFIFLFKRALRKPNILAGWHRLLLRLPMIGITIRLINTARFAHTLAMLNQAGIEVLEAMKVSAETVANVLIRDSLIEATRQVREGVPIYRALQKTRYFPPLSIQLITSGENSGQLSPMLERAANAQENAVQSRISLLLTLFEPAVILIMGGVVLFIVLAILLPIFNLDQLAG